MSKSKVFRAVCLLLCVGVLSLLATACGSSGNDNTATTLAGGTNLATSAAPTSLATTFPPTTMIPTTTFPPFVPDPSQSYWDQMTAAMAYYGFTGGDFPFGTDESTCLGKVSFSQVSKSDIDLTGSNMNFTVAKEVSTVNVPANWWEACGIRNADKNFTIADGDIYVGCLWVKDANGENPAEVYLAIKTPTDGWSTEGSMSISEIYATGDWTQIWFYGSSSNDEPDSSQVQFQLLLGFGPQIVDIGGLFVEHFPGTDANYAALNNFPAS